MKKYFIKFSFIILTVFLFAAIAGCGDQGLTVVFMPSPTPELTMTDTGNDMSGIDFPENGIEDFSESLPTEWQDF